ncbi:hypothetical protein VTL71DRAFT_9864 [Oculimacula yallundae]|uniref:Uncharacterized protein n=1 Tax=Oculimacula yallundae TaxID=86028 RepID=A0ABR4BQR8_9HELO
MPQKQVFVVCERTFNHQDDKGGSLEIESVHTTLESANRWALALANNRFDEFEGCVDRHKDPRRKSRKTKWGTLFTETITTPAEDDFAIEYYVEVRDLEGDELYEDSDREAPLKTAPAPKSVEVKEAFDGMKFSWVGELDDMAARDEIRYLVFDNGGAWRPIEECLEKGMPDYVIAGKNIPQKHQRIIDDKDLCCINRQAFLKMAKNLGLSRSTINKQPINPLKCLARLNFTVLGNVEEPDGRLTKSLMPLFGGQVRCDHTSQMDYVVRRGSNSPADLELFEEECRKYLKIENPTIITSTQAVKMILERVHNSLPAENPRLSITHESIKTFTKCLDGFKFSIPTGDGLIDGMNVQNYVRYQGGQVLGSIHAMDLADYVVAGGAGLSDEHSAMAAQYGVKVLTTIELRELVKRLEPWRAAKEELGMAMGYSHHIEPKKRKRKATSTSISGPLKKSTKLAA